MNKAPVYEDSRKRTENDPCHMDFNTRAQNNEQTIGSNEQISAIITITTMISGITPNGEGMSLVSMDKILPMVLCETIEGHFENFEYCRNQQDTWHSMKLDDIINLYPNKSLGENLKIFLEKVNEMKFGLPQGLNNDEILHHKIRSACETHLAFTSVCDRSSPTVNGLISDLQTSATKYDRYYNLNRNRNRISQPPRKYYRYELPDGCIVCSKKSCWSKNHSKQEIDKYQDSG
ncbi:hypothetical protein GcC1_218041 [Golovinomyces cichoracearum]|uniref:Uncharacterized protein n=1 Tax=Golovinomyces cichoracearum TaxID=62708 RepID=A0A420H8G2_9PEZI|nr:hypothetical protein GcC1_218041 [Golovinomyces cichoracearum]